MHLKRHWCGRARDRPSVLRSNLLRAALDRIKSGVNPAHYEMYHLHVVQGLSPRDTARTLGVSTASVYLAKQRVGKLVKTELRRLSKRGL